MSGALHWIIREGAGATIAEALAHAPDHARAAASEGRAFLDGRRVLPTDLAKPGETLVIYEARDADDTAVRILAHVGGLIVADKPASLPTTPDRRGERSLIGEVARLLDVRLVHAASRLDVGVSGAVLCAIDDIAQRHIDTVRDAGQLHRTYAGIAGAALEGDGSWDTAIGRAPGGSGRSKPIVGGRDAEPASTRFRAIARGRGAAPRTTSTLTRFEPITGRMHQIRVHAAAAGAPLIGDREHGGARTLVDATGRVHALHRIALHAVAVELPGENGKRIRAVSPIPYELRAIWKILDGDEAAWETLAAPA